MKLPWPTWTKRRWYVVVFLVALIVLPALVYRWDGNAASIVIYWLTALIVLAYTYETYCMRLEMVRQNEITIQPLLITSIEHRPEPGTGAAGRIEVLIIRNLGRGAALFIRVADIEITLEHTQESPLLARFNAVDYLEAGKDVIAEVGFYSKEELTRHFDYMPNLNPKHANRTHKITLRYEDIDRGERYSVMQMGKDGIRLLDHGTGSP